METNSDFDKEKIYVYIDNFNFYHGIKKWDDVKWLDYKKMVQAIVNLLPDGKNKYLVEKIKIFTSRTPLWKPDGNGEEQQKRQKNYEKAQNFKNKGVVEFFYGKFQPKTKFDKIEKREKITGLKEKQTDVKMALNIVKDANEDKYNTAIIVSGDGDFVPALRIIKNEYHKKIIVAFPPRYGDSGDLKGIANETRKITKKLLEKCRFDKIIKAENGEIIAECPKEWKWQTKNND